MARPPDDAIGTCAEVPVSASPGWYPTSDVPGGLRWWDGHEWAPTMVVPANRRPAPSSGRVITYFAMAALSLALTSVFGAWGYSSLERDCRQESPKDVDYCINDASMGVDMLAMFGLVACLAFLVLAIIGWARRRSS